ncbi:sugar MFS transporter [Terricaulis sp.]|uniref:sugar MFS transporter n=1 Tax=Terricaulis sp. TaxID=2768686 RepID=UPI003784ED2D
MSEKAGSGAAFGYVTTLFFAWGFVTSVIDPLVASVKAVFQLNYTEAMLTQFAWFIAYGVASLPAAAILSRVGYSRAILIALGGMLAGCLMIPVATTLDLYPGVLAALFVIASGVTLLQVAANPLSAALGRPEHSHFRLTLSQAFNSLGTVLGPRLGASVMLAGGVFAGGAALDHAVSRTESLRAIDLAFLIVGAFFLFVGVLIWTARRRIDAAAPDRSAIAGAPWAAFRSGWALFGALAIFLYVGAEVSIGSMLTNFLHDNIPGSTMQSAGEMVSYYWGGAMVGRFVGSALLRRASAGVLLSIAALSAAGLCLVVTQLGGATGAYVALTIGLFNSIMFPVIFTITLDRSSAAASATSGLLCMAIVGGAALPVLAGKVADLAGTLTPAFFVPMAGYLGVALFAIAAARGRPRTASATPPAPAH